VDQHLVEGGKHLALLGCVPFTGGSPAEQILGSGVEETPDLLARCRPRLAALAVDAIAQAPQKRDVALDQRIEILIFVGSQQLLQSVQHIVVIVSVGRQRLWRGRNHERVPLGAPIRKGAEVLVELEPGNGRNGVGRGVPVAAAGDPHDRYRSP
jgi:hypothetical protein